MHTVALSRTGLGMITLGRTGLGTAPLGDPGPEAEARAYAVLDRAASAGITYFDTAPLYGAGAAERRLGTILATRPRSSYVVSTKAGRRVLDEARRKVGYDFSRDGIQRSIDDSLERLRLDQIDVVYLHDPDQHERIAMTEAYPVLDDLRSEGVIGEIGVGTNSSVTAARFVRDTDVDVVLIAGRYTLLEQPAAEDLLPAALDRGVSVVVGGVYNSGILADPYASLTYNYTAPPTDVVRRARRLADTCAAHGVSIKAAALQFAAAHPAVSCALVGCSSPEEVDENLTLLRTPIPQALWNDLLTTAQLPPTSAIPT
jgi:D-threo-aldose 1-dehydrogenase